ncbi:MAG: phosphomannomutase, partial [Verrucomicrobia bacterium RIFCSPHIGHO2_12_FULL_41_10]
LPFTSIQFELTLISIFKLMNTLLNLVTKAEGEGHLSSASTQNIRKLLAQATSSFEESVIAELVAEGDWEELNNRFFTTLAFGTGGLRGKTIGAHVTKVEEGVKRPDGRPEFACVGTNAVNNYNIVRATRGLVTYVSQWHQKQQRSGRSKICISYDTRFFSREFAELAAKVITEHGCDALMFEAPRSTPELSFAVRHCEATAGINITASHNPPQYNGYKVYFEDGGQIIEPHASAIIQLVESMEGESYEPLPKEQQGEIVLLGQEIDEAYMKRLETLVLHPSLMKQKPALKVVYTPLHGVGGVIILPMLHRLGVECLPVASQMLPDGLFSTVKSPNPENAEALTLGMELANKEGAHLVLATDPDDDRMGVAARNAGGELQLLTGNQIGALMVWYRLTQLFSSGILNKKNRGGAVIIKSLVTTDLQKVIAEKFGVRCVETLTGFKYIGAKLCSYEEQLPMELQVVYRTLSEVETREARLEHSSYFVFGGEESYGYSMGDFVRDKD